MISIVLNIIDTILYYLCTLILLYPLSIVWTSVQQFLFNLIFFTFVSYSLNVPDEEEFFSYVEQDMIFLKRDIIELDYDTAEIINKGWFSRGLIKTTNDNDETSTIIYIFILGKWFKEDSFNVTGLKKLGKLLENSINSVLSFIFCE